MKSMYRVFLDVFNSRPEDLVGRPRRTFAGRRLVSERRSLLLRLQRQPRLVPLGAANEQRGRLAGTTGRLSARLRLPQVLLN